MFTSCQITFGSDVSFLISWGWLFTVTHLSVVTSFSTRPPSSQCRLNDGEFGPLTATLDGVTQLLFVLEVDGNDWLSATSWTSTDASDDHTFSFPKRKDFHALALPLRFLVFGSVLAFLTSSFSTVLLEKEKWIHVCVKLRDRVSRVKWEKCIYLRLA